jgi:hypothetical protein
MVSRDVLILKSKVNFKSLNEITVTCEIPYTPAEPKLISFTKVGIFQNSKPQFHCKETMFLLI